jgi:tetratricopeptide (TPR) repeat protein
VGITYALKQGKTIIAVEAEPFDNEKFNQTFPQGISHYINMGLAGAFLKVYLPTFDTGYLRSDNERCYLLGMAYLKGIMVERNVERAVELLELAAENGSMAAMMRLSAQYRIRFEYDKALQWDEKALSVAKEKDENSVHTAELLSQLSNVYFAKGEYDKALKSALELLRIYEELGHWSIEIADSNNLISAIYGAKSDSENAIIYAKKAIETRKFMKVQQEPAYYLNYASALSYKGKHDEALPLLLKAVSLAESQYGEEHIETAAAYMNIARNYLALGDLIQAAEFNEKALTIQNKILSPNHPKILETLTDFAFICGEQGDYQQALFIYYHCAAEYEQIFGTDNEQTLSAYFGITNSLFGLGKKEEANAWLKKSFAIDSKLKGIGSSK